MLQVPDAVDSAVKELVERCKTGDGLAEESQQHLLQLPTWPSCLVAVFPDITAGMPLQDAAALWCRIAAPSSPASLADVLAARHSNYMQERMVQEMGKLEEVWQDVQRARALLTLPLQLLQLLLASDKLQVRCRLNLMQR